jgi:hypothetical protein
MSGGDAFRCLADNVMLDENTTLAENCTIAVEARSAQVEAEYDADVAAGRIAPPTQVCNTLVTPL